jgi:hypothetical protein
MLIRRRRRRDGAAVTPGSYVGRQKRVRGLYCPPPLYSTQEVLLLVLLDLRPRWPRLLRRPRLLW